MTWTSSQALDAFISDGSTAVRLSAITAFGPAETALIQTRVELIGGQYVYLKLTHDDLSARISEIWRGDSE